MNKNRKTSHILNVFQFDANGHVILPATLTIGENPHSSDNTSKIPSTAWIRTYVTGLSYLTGNQSITVSGDATGSGTTAITLTLANTAVTPGTYGSTTLVPVVTVDSKGRITSVTTAAISGSLTFTGDVTGSGTTGTSTALTLAASGVTAGTYTKVTVDSKGRVTVGANASTTDISEGTNLYYTDTRVGTYLTANSYATQSYVGTQIANLVASAPATLDTLNELAAALGNDPSFATTVSTSIGTKVPQTRTLTINGTGYDLSADRSWTINSMVYPGAGIALSTGTAWGTSITDNSANWNTAYGWGNHASGGYLTSATAATTYASLTGTYANPAFISSLAYSKITGVPAFLTSYTETDPYRVTSVAVSGTSTKTITLTRADASTVTTTWTDIDTDTNTYVTSAGFSGGTLTLTRNDAGTVTVSLDGRYYLASNPSGYITGITSSNVTTALGYTPYNSTNPSGYITGINSSAVTTALGYTPWNYASIDAGRNIVSGTNLDTDLESGGAYGSYGAGGTSWNAPFSYGAVLAFAFTSGIKAQFGFDIRHNQSDYGDLHYRTKNNLGYSTWRTMWHSGNLTNNNQLTNGAGYITSSGSISGNAATATSAATVTGSSTIGGYLTLNVNWGVSPYTAAFNIVGTHPSMVFRGSNGDTHYLIHMDANGDMQYYFGPGYTTNNWTRRYEFSKGGNFTCVTGTISATNFSGSSSGTNTGDQTNISGNAGTVTNATFYRQFTVRDDRSDGGDYNLSGRATGLYAIASSGSNGPGYGYLSLIHVANGSDVAFQIAGGYNSDAMYFRGTTALQNGTGYSSWRTVIHSGNIGSQSVSYASTAGTAGNITAYTINQSVGTGNSPTFVDIYANEWFRNNNVNEGLYNQATGVHFYSHAATGWTVTGSGGIAEIVFRSNHQTTIRGYVYADTSNNIGFLTNDGNWGLQVDSSKNVKVFGTDLTVGNTTSSNIYMTDTDESTRRIHCNSGRIGFLNTANGWGAYCDNSGNWFANNLSGTNTGDQTNISGSAGSAGSAGYAGYLSTAYAGGQQTNPQVYFNNGVGLKAAMTGAWSVWSDTLWINGYSGGDVKQMCALHTLRNGTPRMSISVQAHDATAYGAFYEFITEYNIASQTVSKLNPLSGDSNYKLAYTADGARTNAGEWGRAVMYYIPNGQTYGIRVDRADAANNITDYTINQSVGSDNSPSFHTVPTYYLRNRYDVSVDHPYGIYFNTSVSDYSYAIYRQSGAWSHPYPDLHIAFHTGIKIGAYYGYNGTRFYNNSDWVTITASVNDGDNHFRGYYDIIAYASDKRLKHNIQVIDNAIDKVMKLTGMTYQWNNVGSKHGWEPDTETREAGVFAQEVQEVLPEAVKLAPFDNNMGVSKSGENFLTVKYEKIVPLLIEAIKEQQLQIEELKNKLDGLTR